METKNENQVSKTPPYVAFATFLNAITSLSEHGIPSQIDYSVLSKFSGGIQRQLYPALRFMALIDDDNRPTELLRSFADADESGKKQIIGNIIKERFPNQIAILPNGTVQQLNSSFDYIKLEASVKVKCITFFLKAAEYAELKISPHISRGKRTSKTGMRRTKWPKKTKKKQEDYGIGEEDRRASGLKRHPITLGFDKVWFIEIDDDYSNEDIARFTEMIKLALSKPSK